MKRILIAVALLSASSVVSAKEIPVHDRNAVKLITECLEGYLFAVAISPRGANGIRNIDIEQMYSKHPAHGEFKGYSPQPITCTGG